MLLACAQEVYRAALRAEDLLAHRGRAKAPERRPPRAHIATRPDQVWSWDITKLKGPAKWTCFHLYVILDIFSPPSATTGIDRR